MCVWNEMSMYVEERGGGEFGAEGVCDEVRK